MSAKTARKYLKSGSLPSQCKAVHDWATHPDAFAQDWPWVEDFLKNNTGLESKSLFEALQREYPRKYQDGQLRTFQRQVKQWKALYGPGQEVFFPQIYKPGYWFESDFTRMKKIGITICGVPFGFTSCKIQPAHPNENGGVTNMGLSRPERGKIRISNIANFAPHGGHSLTVIN